MKKKSDSDEFISDKINNRGRSVVFLLAKISDWTYYISESKNNNNNNKSIIFIAYDKI